MSNIIKISTPLADEVISSLCAGDEVFISGTVYTARDQAHKRLCQLIHDNKPLPFDLAGAIIYFVGPTPATNGRPIGSAGPTTSSRMDAFSPTLLTRGLKAMIGKGHRSQQVIQALKDNNAVHLAAIGGAGALLSKHITASEVIAFDELGTEAVRKLEFKDFPAIVAYDSKGNSAYSL